MMMEFVAFPSCVFQPHRFCTSTLSCLIFTPSAGTDTGFGTSPSFPLFSSSTSSAGTGPRQAQELQRTYVRGNRRVDVKSTTPSAAERDAVERKFSVEESCPCFRTAYIRSNIPLHSAEYVRSACDSRSISSLRNSEASHLSVNV
jgi:hypothetical protein